MKDEVNKSCPFIDETADEFSCRFRSRYHLVALDILSPEEVL